jgi:hypothetical protein
MPYKDPNCPAAIASRNKRAKRYYEKHREKLLEREKTCPKRLKALRISSWKRSGVVGDYDELYTIWLAATECWCCKNDLSKKGDKCLDHDHETGKFRQILCRDCNNWDRWKNKDQNNNQHGHLEEHQRQPGK